jgi:hypothetical protein
VAYGGGGVAGVLVAWFGVQVRKRVDDPLQESVTVLLLPFTVAALVIPALIMPVGCAGPDCPPTMLSHRSSTWPRPPPPKRSCPNYRDSPPRKASTTRFKAPVCPEYGRHL